MTSFPLILCFVPLEEAFQPSQHWKRWPFKMGTYLTLPLTGAAVAKPLLKMKLRFAAVKALREAVLNNLGRTIDATAEFSQLVVEAEMKRGLG